MKTTGFIDFPNVASLRSSTLIPQPYDKVLIQGSGMYDWEEASVATDNGYDIIKQDNLATGRWRRIGWGAMGLSPAPENSTKSSPEIVNNKAHNLNIVDWSRSAIILKTKKGVDITGFNSTGVIPYKMYMVINGNNIEGKEIKLKKQDDDSDEGNRFLFNDDIKIAPGEFWLIYFDPAKNGFFGLSKP